MTGTIKTVVPERGFGFITADDGRGDFLFHRSAVTDQAYDDIQEGERVEFEPEANSPKGPRAKTVSRVVPATAT
jgi:CspA family cold shock protein